MSQRLFAIMLLLGGILCAQHAVNTNVNWASGTTWACTINGTSCHQVDLTLGTAAAVGAASMTAQQFMDLTILHELAHTFGLDHPATNSANTVGAFNTSIWVSCFK